MSNRRGHHRRSGRPTRPPPSEAGAAGGDRSAGGVAMFEVGGSPEFLAMLDGLGLEMCDVEDCDGAVCGRWHRW